MATKNTQRQIQVYAHWQDFKEPFLMGALTAVLSRGKEIFLFEYTKEWLNSGNAQYLDPNLQLYSGPQYLEEGKSNFGIFLDSSPDRWGRLLMRKREAAMARSEDRKENTLFETDYLLGVFDGHRMGGIRFKVDEDGPFLNDNKKMASPPWTSLRELEHASLQLEKDDVINDPEYLKWLFMLVAPGSSLGGARPKASVVDPEGHLWIAKFPSMNDDKDTGAWEMVVNELAISAGINAAVGMLRKFSGKYSTFLTKRFDRTSDGERIHFASAMTLLGYSDGNDFHDGVSYLQLAEFITQNGASPNNDLEELFRRIVFNICVKNTDDHLRNHGFLLTNQGWILSPAYDMNPVETGAGLKLNISETDNSLNLDLTMEVSGYFRLTEKQAAEIIETVKNSISKWRDVATKYNISRSDQDKMSNAFGDDKESGYSTGIFPLF